MPVDWEFWKSAVKGGVSYLRGKWRWVIDKVRAGEIVEIKEPLTYGQVAMFRKMFPLSKTGIGILRVRHPEERNKFCVLIIPPTKYEELPPEVARYVFPGFPRTIDKFIAIYKKWLETGGEIRW